MPNTHLRSWRLLPQAGALVVLLLLAVPALAEQVGEVSTTFKVLGSNDKIVVEAFDDPDIGGVTCYLSRAKRGGIKGSLGLAEDTSDASISCRQVGPVSMPAEVRSKKWDGREVFKKRTSILFKTMQVVRFYDKARNVLIYLTYSDKIVDGSPKNAISCVPIQEWNK